MPTWIFQLRAMRSMARSLVPNRRNSQAVATPALVGILIAALSSPAIAPTQTHHAPPSVASKQPPTREDYAGDQACRSCHEDEFKTYQSTAHHLTSRAADAHSIAGSFATGANVFKTANPSLSFKMTADADGFHQTAVDEVSPGKNVELTERFDIVVGVRKSQTYLYWKNEDLFELPISWWSGSGDWINSPGYEDGAVRFDRPVYPRCLECHASSFKSLAPPPNRYEPTSLVLGIECERCHGPGREHVARYSSAHPPKAAALKAIVNPASLPRNRQIDTCALCHAGLGNTIRPALSFQPGDPLEKYLQFPDTDTDSAVDVHGNQVELLKRSRCFRSSTMTCITCHNVHQAQNEAASFSKFCLNCHKAQQCGKFATMGAQITNNCIDCHMPLKKSQALFSNSNNQMIQLPVRDHDIAIYADSTTPSPHHP